MDKQTSLELRCSENNEILENLTWEDANKKTQECMVSYFITDMKPRMNLSNQEIEQLRQTIYFGISNKYFDKNNIILVKNRIQTISGLFWDEKDLKLFEFDS